MLLRAIPSLFAWIGSRSGSGPRSAAVFVASAFLCLLALLGTSSISSIARADVVRRAGTVRVEASGGGKGPVELTASKDGFAGEIVLVNEGKEPLVVSRIAVRGDVADPRTPNKLTTRLEGASLPVTIAPGTSRKAIVTWTPDKGIRQRQLFGHVIVTTSDEQSGEVAMGVRAQIPGLFGPLEAHVLSLLVALPLLGAIATFVARALGRRDDRTPHLVATIALGLQTLFALYVYRGFSSDVSRMDGNDGLQFVEHAVWIRSLSVEVYLGVDGIAAIAILVTSAVSLLSLLPDRTVPRSASGFHATFLVLNAAATGALVSMDALLFVVFATIAVISAALLVGTWGSEGSRRAAMRLAVPGLVAVTLLLVVALATSRHADPTFLVDGTKVTTTFSLPELSRVALGAKGATIFGLPLVKVGIVFVLAASLFFLAAFPAHGWFVDTLGEAPPATAVLVSAALPAIGLAALLRFGFAVFPEGTRWASGVVVALGAVTTAYGALGALGQTDLRKLAGWSTVAQSGFVLLGAGSLTPQGISGAIVLVGTRALACSVVLMLAGAVDDRVRTHDTGRLGGVASQMPGWSAALAAALLGQAGVLGVGGAWGPLLALLGALPSYAPLAIVSAIALVVLAIGHLSALGRVAFGKPDASWERSEMLEPFGGRFPDLSPREWSCVAPLVAIVLLLGVWPAPIVSVTTGTARDLANAVSPPGPDQIAAASSTSASPTL